MNQPENEFDIMNPVSDIKEKLDYPTLRAEAENKLFNSVNSIIDFFCAMVIALVVCFIFFALLSMLGPSGGPLGAVNNIFMWISIVLMFCSVIGMLTCFKRIKTYVYYYKADLRRIREKLTYSDIYMDIPAEDINKYNNFFRLIKRSLQNRKKTLEK